MRQNSVFDFTGGFMSDVEDHGSVEFESIDFEDDAIELTDVMGEEEHPGNQSTDDPIIDLEEPVDAAVQLDKNPPDELSGTDFSTASPEQASEEEPIDLVEVVELGDAVKKPLDVSETPIEAMMEKLIEEKYGNQLNELFTQAMEKVLNKKMHALKKKLLKELKDDVDTP